MINISPTERRSAKHGFTLVELMVVIVIIGLLATIVAINVIPATDTARVEKAKADIATIEQALEQYRLDNLSYPAGTEGLQALDRKSTRLTPVTNAHLVCRLLLEKQNTTTK